MLFAILWMQIGYPSTLYGVIELVTTFSTQGWWGPKNIDLSAFMSLSPSHSFCERLWGHLNPTTKGTNAQKKGAKENEGCKGFEGCKGRAQR